MSSIINRFMVTMMFVAAAHSLVTTVANIVHRQEQLNIHAQQEITEEIELVTPPIPEVVEPSIEVIDLPNATLELHFVVQEVDVMQATPLIRITAYNAVPGQTDDSPDISSCGPNLPNQIAVSQDLFFDENGRKHLCGVPAVLMMDDGTLYYGVIWDTMNARYHLSADILLDDYDEAVDFGVNTGKLVILAQR